MWRQDVDFAVSQQTPHDPAGPYAGVWSPKWLMYFHLRNACEMQPDSIRLPWRSFKNSKLMTCKTFENNVLPKILRLANPPRSCFKSTHQSPSKRAKSVGCPGLSLPLFFTTLQISTYYGNSETLALKHQEIRTFHFNCAWISVSCCLDFKSSSFIRTKIPIPFSSVRAAAQYHLQVTRVTFSGLLNALDGVIATEAHMGKPRHCSGELRWMLFYGCLMIPVRYWKFNVYR